jgi:hypothetical protein
MIAGAGTTASASRVTVTMQDTRVEGNSALLQGGGVQLTRNVSGVFTRVQVVDNQITGSPVGGAPAIAAGIFGGEQTSLTLDHSTVANNRMLSATSATLEDGGGGIMFTARGAGSSLTVRNSTISGNSSTIRGGGVFMVGTSQATLVNSTVSGNRAPDGGGVLASGSVTLRSVTLFGNRADNQAAGIGVVTGGVVTVQSAVLANNRVGVIPSNCTAILGGAINTLGHNLSDDATCTSLVNVTDRPNTSSGVSPALQDNGGPTFTHALLAGSAAIDAGSPSACPPTDQRGAQRQGLCDMGAVEFTTLAPRVASSLEGMIGAPRLPKPMPSAARRVPDRLMAPSGLGPAGGSAGASAPRR